MPTCPCCSDRLLRHIRKGSLYWFCRSCWAEMPNFEAYKKPPVVTPVKVQPVFAPFPLRLQNAKLQEQPMQEQPMQEQPILVKPPGSQVKLIRSAA